MHRLFKLGLFLSCVLIWVPALAETKAELTIKPDPPETGESVISISLVDGEKPISDAKVSLLAYMPAMGSMPYMEMPATVESMGDGKYRATLLLSMGGTWELTLTAERNDQKEVLRYSLTTGIPGIASKNNSKTTASGAGTQKEGLLNLGVDRIQKIGVRTSEVKVNNLEKTVRAVGVVEADSTRRAEVSLRAQSYVQKVWKGRVGETVKAGQALFSIYSPELVTAQNEFLLAHNLGRSEATLHASSAERLKNLGMLEREIEEIKKTGKAKREITIVSPIAGTILEVNAREGASANAGDVLYVIGDLSKNFIVARVFQQDLADLRVGQLVRIVIPESGMEAVDGRIDLLFPNVSEGAGTGNVRVVPGAFVRQLRPGRYVDLRFPITLGDRLSIPTEAILYSGLHRYVFVDLGEGILEPREVTTGAQAGSLIEVTSGLRLGEKIVVSGNFLLSSEAQLRSALPKWKKEDAK